jgi:branched-subunit amino acid aminotransferase/4-amino-4-deoxychorismate lyase
MLKLIRSEEGLWESPESLTNNRSFFFGDGFFETMRIGPNAFFPLAAIHADRIKRSATALGFSDFFDMNQTALLNLILEFLPENLEGDHRLKLLFFRKGGGAYAPLGDCTTGIYAELQPLSLPFFSFLDWTGIAESLYIRPNEFGWIKSSSALQYVMAGIERQKRGLDEIILTSPDGYVVEGSYTSICWKESNRICFPSRQLGGIDACQRRFIEGFFRESGIAFSEVVQVASELLEKADWICFSSGLGLRFFMGKENSRQVPDEFSGFPVDGFYLKFAPSNN